MRSLAVICLLVASAAAAAPVIPSSGFVLARDGTRVYYEIAGSGPKTVVVSGGFYNREALNPLTHSWRVVFFDARGRGRSDAVPAERVSLQHQIDDVEDLLDALQLESAVLLGWSGMGKELFAFAIQHPARVERLVQVAPVAPYAGDFLERMMTTRMARVDQAALAELRQKREAGVWANDPAGYCRAEAAVANVMTFANPANAVKVPDSCVWPNEWPVNLAAYFAALLPTNEAYDARDDLPANGLPRLVIYGAEDAIPADAMEAWVAGDDDACLIEVADAAHWPFIEQPQAFFTAVNAFIAGIGPPACVDD